MGFFIYSNTLEIHVINLRGQDSLKTQKFVQKIEKSQSRSIYVRHGVMVSTFAFKSEGHEFESWPGQVFFYSFPKNDYFRATNHFCDSLL